MSCDLGSWLSILYSWIGVYYWVVLRYFSFKIYAIMSNIVVPVLSVTIGLFFVFVGTIKLTPFVSEEFYKEMVNRTMQSFSHSPEYILLIGMNKSTVQCYACFSARCSSNLHEYFHWWRWLAGSRMHRSIGVFTEYQKSSAVFCWLLYQVTAIFYVIWRRTSPNSPLPPVLNWRP